MAKLALIQRAIEDIGGMEKNWIEEDSRKGNDPNKDLGVRVARMLIILYHNWLDSEKELFQLEEEFRNIFKTETEKIVRRKH